MADVISDGTTRVTWVPGISGIANIAAPAAAELNAGINATSQITNDGLISWEAATAGVVNTSLASKTDTSRAGRDSFPGPKLRVKQQDSDTILTTLTKGTFGHIVIRRGIATATAWVTGQKVQVFPVECGRRVDMPHEDNTMTRYEIPFFVHTEPNHDAVVA